MLSEVDLHLYQEAGKGREGTTPVIDLFAVLRRGT